MCMRDFAVKGYSWKEKNHTLFGLGTIIISLQRLLHLNPSSTDSRDELIKI